MKPKLRVTPDKVFVNQCVFVHELLSHATQETSNKRFFKMEFSCGFRRLQLLLCLFEQTQFTMMKFNKKQIKTRERVRLKLTVVASGLRRLFTFK